MTEYGTEPLCVACGMRLPPLIPQNGKATQFCPYCGAHLESGTQKSQKTSHTSVSPTTLSHESTVSIPRGKSPTSDEIQFTLGPYQVLRSLGKGGMGEVFLAYDPTCGRRMAVKRIREDLVTSQQLQSRFLKEARLTSQLTHPAIIPIYSIHVSEQLIYYTMPFVEGETLKQILRSTRLQEKKGGAPHPIGSSIPALTRIFMTLCQAVAYAHNEGVLHRDLKPENVMIGQYGQVMILDWGLAQLRDAGEEAIVSNPKLPRPGATRLGKVVGTATYIAPERALGKPANVQSEVYALGVILYQLLALQMPFGRKTMKDLRPTLSQGVFIDPAEIAPDREVPPMLSQIASKCLAFNVEQRYANVNELIRDLELFLEGRSEWLQSTTLDTKRKADWEFQEHVLIAKHVEITRHTEEVDWVHLMVSRLSFPGNCMIEAKVQLNEGSAGVGILFAVPEAAERIHLTDGYCLWMGSERTRDTRLQLSAVDVMGAPESILKTDIWYDVRIEKIDNNIHFSLNNQMQFSYNSLLPASGTHVGFMSRDAFYHIKDFKVHSGSQNLTVSCLSVPDAFLAHHQHGAALAEYRRIAYSFPGRAVGREALLNAGITLLDQGLSCDDREQRNLFFDQALDEFGKLHGTPGAPLEYLGKALVYQAQEEFDEEIKCFELALRKYRGHRLMYMLQDRVIHRLHESSRAHRLAAYQFACLVVRLLPALSHLPNAQRLFSSLQRHWEPLPFLSHRSDSLLLGTQLGIPLAFWVAKPFAIAELVEEIAGTTPLDVVAISDALFCLVELGATQLLQQLMERLNELDDAPLASALETLQVVLKPRHEWLATLLPWPTEGLTSDKLRIVMFVIEQQLCDLQPDSALNLINHFTKAPWTESQQGLLKCYAIWAYLLKQDYDTAHLLLHAFPDELLHDETQPVHFLYGCYLNATEGRHLVHVHFSGSLESAYPRLWSLIGQFITGRISEEDGWTKKAFLWEKRYLFRQLTLFYLCGGNRELADLFAKRERDTYLDVEP